MDEAAKQVPKQLQPYVWQKGQSGNPDGRPKGKTLKEFAREYLMSLPDDEKVDYLASLPTDIVWKMAEGNPANNTDLTTGGQPIVAGFNFIKNGDHNTNNTPNA
jgi:Family of unknown function (DUF5681)